MKQAAPPYDPESNYVLWSPLRRAYWSMSGAYTRRIERIRYLTMSQAAVLHGQLSEPVVIKSAPPVAAPVGTAKPVLAGAKVALNDLDETELLRRAVLGLAVRDRPQAPRWCAVMDTLGLTSAGAVGLCRRLKLDPMERTGF